MAKIEVQCRCGRVLKVSDKHAGRSGRCKDCGATVAIPSPADPDAAAPVHALAMDDADAPASVPVVRDSRHEMLVRMLQAELDACGFDVEESSALFPAVASTPREQPRTIEADLELVQKIRLRVEKRTEERVRRMLTEKILSALNATPPAEAPTTMRGW